MAAPHVARATIARLPRYLAYLEGLGEDAATVSSQQLADGAAVKDAIVRRDMSDLGVSGTRGVGYDVQGLVTRFRTELGFGAARRVVIIGAGNLGHALANHHGFEHAGFEVVGCYDTDPVKLGRVYNGIPVKGMESLVDDVAAADVTMAIITVPGSAAQEILDVLVGAGVRSILSFAPTTLTHPADVDVRHVDLATELQVLAYFAK